MWNKVGTKQGAESASVSHPPSTPSSASHWLPCPQDLISCGQHCHSGAHVGQCGDGEGSSRGSDHGNNTGLAGLLWSGVLWEPRFTGLFQETPEGSAHPAPPTHQPVLHSVPCTSLTDDLTRLPSWAGSWGPINEKLEIRKLPAGLPRVGRGVPGLSPDQGPPGKPPRTSLKTGGWWETCWGGGGEPGDPSLPLSGGRAPRSLRVFTKVWGVTWLHTVVSHLWGSQI